MSDTGQRTAEFLAVVIENAELRQTLAEVQDQCVELAVDTGELHAEIEVLRAELVATERDGDRWRAEAERRLKRPLPGREEGVMDKFTKAIAEVGDYIAGGMEMDEAVAEVAAEFDLPVHSLKNRAERSIGDITAYRAMKKDEMIRARIEIQMRRPFFERTWDSEMILYRKRHPE